MLSFTSASQCGGKNPARASARPISAAEPVRLAEGTRAAERRYEAGGGGHGEVRRRRAVRRDVRANPVGGFPWENGPVGMILYPLLHFHDSGRSVSPCISGRQRIFQVMFGVQIGPDLAANRQKNKLQNDLQANPIQSSPFI